MIGIAFGPMRASERAWVATTFLRSYEHAESAPREHYWRVFGDLVDALLDAGDTVVARNAEDETQAMGFLCRSKTENVLHYLYNKWNFRDRQGMGPPIHLAAKLIGESGLHVERGLRCTFTTVAWVKYAAKHGLQYEHDRQLVTVTRAAIRRVPQRETSTHG